ncbi:BLUF domain-containing protein [uncultured Xylophilus sp.]|uniref:BLUF domain-containing protein n=1 Tax=uncultured Xylophilus sp. TaxID=296832 RepID=UPI0025FF9804|nr:BLUF domain-containing protein [uncultured Xylophilus sp.]
MYVSFSQLEDGEMLGILEDSRQRNAQHGITSALMSCGEYRFQVLEGPESQVDALMDRIETSSRHKQMKRVLKEQTGVRHYALWTMGYVALPQAGQLLMPLLKFTDEERAKIISSMMLRELRRGHGTH